MKAKKCLAISCPEKQFDQFESLIDGLKEQFEVVPTLDQASSIDVDLVLCIGGDGSLNYLVNSLFLQDFDGPLDVLYLPNGTANDFARSLKLNFPAQLSADQVCEVVKGRYKVNVPLLECNDRFFLNVASVGLPAEVTESKDSTVKEFSGVLGYYISAVSTALSDKKFNFELKENNNPSYQRETFGFFISQGLYAGGGVKVNGSFSPCFGDHFNFLIPQSSEKLEALVAATKIQNGDASTDDIEIDSKFLRELHVSSEQEIPVKLDGEDYKAQSMVFKRSRRNLNFFLY